MSKRKWLTIGAAVVLGVPAALCAATGVAGLAVDGDVDVGVVEELGASPAVLVDHLDDVDSIALWWDVAMEAYAAEHGSAPEMEVVHVEGTPTSGPGCQLDFVAAGMAMETWEILEVRDEAIVYDIDFKLMRVERTLTIEPTAAGSRVTWRETGHIGNPWMRLLGAVAGGSEGVEANFRGALQALEQAAR